MSAAILTLLIMSGLTIILLVFVQSGAVKSVGSSITNAQDLELFENKKIRGVEKALNIGTWLAVIAFITFSIILFITL